MDAPSIVSRRTSVGNLIKLGCPFQRTKLYHFDVGLFIVEMYYQTSARVM